MGRIWVGVWAAVVLATGVLLFGCAPRQAAARPGALLRPSSYTVLATAYEKGVDTELRRVDLEQPLRSRLSGWLVPWAGFEVDAPGLQDRGSQADFDWSRGVAGVQAPADLVPAQGEGLRLVLRLRVVAPTKARSFWEWIGAIASVAIDMAKMAGNLDPPHLPAGDAQWKGVDLRWALVQPGGLVVASGMRQGDIADIEKVLAWAVQDIKNLGGIR
jgi:hypothetical protein